MRQRILFRVGFYVSHHGLYLQITQIETIAMIGESGSQCSDRFRALRDLTGSSNLDTWYSVLATARQSGPHLVPSTLRASCAKDHSRSKLS